MSVSQEFAVRLPAVSSMPQQRKLVPNTTVGLSIQQEALLYRAGRRRKY